MKLLSKIKTILPIACVLFMTIGCIGGSGDMNIHEDVNGGKTIQIDNNAPKEIKSKDIKEFSVSFYTTTRFDENEDGQFYFEVKDDETGNLTAYENRRYLKVPADDDILVELQDIIDEYKLVSDNGIYDVTSGLAPECGPVHLKVLYESGEQLEFTLDGNPCGRWQTDVYDVFAERFRANGEESIFPKKETTKLAVSKMSYQTPEFIYIFDVKETTDKEFIEGYNGLVLNRQILNLKDASDKTIEYVKLPDDYFDNLQKILDKYDVEVKYRFSVYNFDSGSLDNHSEGYYGFSDKSVKNEADSNYSFSWHLKYESDHQIRIDTAKESELNGMQAMIDEVREYNESLFAQ